MKIKILSITLAGFFLATIFPVHAQTGPAQLTDIVKIIETIIKLLAPIAALAFLVMTIIGGYKFVTSGGDPKAVASARSTLTYAILGVILVVAAWLILLLIKDTTGVDVTTVDVPTSHDEGPRPDDR